MRETENTERYSAFKTGFRFGLGASLAYALAAFATTALALTLVTAAIWLMNH